MQPFDLFALAAERRVAREREARSERLRRRSKAVEPETVTRTAPPAVRAGSGGRAVLDNTPMR